MTLAFALACAEHTPLVAAVPLPRISSRELKARTQRAAMGLPPGSPSLQGYERDGESDESDGERFRLD